MLSKKRTKFGQYKCRLRNFKRKKIDYLSRLRIMSGILRSIYRQGIWRHRFKCWKKIIGTWRRRRMILVWTLRIMRGRQSRRWLKYMHWRNRVKWIMGRGWIGLSRCLCWVIISCRVRVMLRMESRYRRNYSNCSNNFNSWKKRNLTLNHNYHLTGV